MNPAVERFRGVELGTQDEVFRQAFEILEQAIDSHSFPGAAVAIHHAGNLLAWKALGRFTYERSSPVVMPDTLFDLASLTKVMATTAMTMALCQRGRLDLEAPLVGVLPQFAGEDSRRGQVTFRMLLAHSSGLPAYEKLFLRARERQALIDKVLMVPLKYAPGTRSEYSDIGFILLGLALEKIAQESLDQFCRREIFDPLGMAHTTFNPPLAWRAAIPPTADDCHFRKRVVQGEVQDENASVLKGVGGHAGLFSTALDVALFAEVMLSGGRPIFAPDVVSRFTRRETSPPGTSRGLGWDTPSHPSQSGKYFSLNSFGHLGYTGTSLWIDPERRLGVSLLTNRTWPDCSNQAIKEIRPRFHDAVIESLERNLA